MLHGCIVLYVFFSVLWGELSSLVKVVSGLHIGSIYGGVNSGDSGPRFREVRSRTWVMKVRRFLDIPFSSLMKLIAPKSRKVRWWENVTTWWCGF